ncbi:MAG: ABC transporter permease, partial [Chloroflexi bacterium]|nr:ABC transporter permease [Chloroflexota bacterium]
MLNDLFSLATLIGILHSGVRLATPYLFAALGETFAQRSGVLNLGVDGMMLMGAFTAFYVVFSGGTVWLGVTAAIGVGCTMGLLMAVVSVTMQAEQGISGIGLYLFGLGLSSLLFKTLIGSVESVSGFPRLALPLLSGLPIVGHIFFNHNVLVYLAYL